MKLPATLSLLLAVALSGGSALAAETAPQFSMKNTSVERLHSPVNGDYRIMVAWPDEPAPPNGWPVIYLLDGDSYFATATEIMRALSCQRCALQPGVIVAIGYEGETRRDRDYRPAVDELKLESNPQGGTYPPSSPGEADLFLDFIQQELKPHIEQSLPIDRQRQALFGHSYGGLFTLHTLFTRPESFQHYAAVSPSVWWNDRYILREATAFGSRSALAQPATLSLSVGEFEQSLERQEMRLTPAQRAQLAAHRGQRRMVDNIRELAWQLEDTKVGQFTVTYRLYAEQNHKTIPPVALQQALLDHFQR